MKTRTVVAFLTLTFAIGWLFQGVAVMSGVQNSGRGWLLASMSAPLLAALLVRESRSLVWTGLKRAGLSFWPIALVSGWAFSVLQQLLLWASGQGQWNSRMFELNADHSRIEAIKHLAMTLGVGPQRFAWFAVNLLVSISLGSLILMVAAVGEEAGWRGFLQGALTQRFGLLKGTLLVGLIWGLWHLPINLAGYNDARHPVLQALVIFPIHTIAISFVLACLMKWSKSVWPAALAHAANNTIQSGPLLLTPNWFDDQLTAVIASILLGILAGALLLQRRSGSSNSVEEQVSRAHSSRKPCWPDQSAANLCAPGSKRLDSCKTQAREKLLVKIAHSRAKTASDNAAKLAKPASRTVLARRSGEMLPRLPVRI